MDYRLDSAPAGARNGEQESATLPAFVGCDEDGLAVYHLPPGALDV